MRWDMVFRQHLERGVRVARASLALVICGVVALALHVHYGQHRFMVINDRSAPIHEIEVSVVGERQQLGPIGVHGTRAAAFWNPWPVDASVHVRIEGADVAAEEYECLYLSFLPQVSVVRLVDRGVDCKRLAPTLLMPVP